MRDYQLVWRGIVHDSTGYAKDCRETILSLDKLGVDIKLEMVNPSNTPAMMMQQEVVQKLNELAKKPYAKDKMKILVLHLQPHQIDMEEAKEGYDMIIIRSVWETSRVPQEWFPNVNMADALMLPCHQNKEASINSGVTVPIKVVSEGIYLDEFSPEAERAGVINPRKEFVFLSIFGWGHRKAPDLLLKAYWSEFTKEDNVCMMIKTFYGYGKQSNRSLITHINGYKQHWGFGNNTAPLYITTNDLDFKQLLDLYAISDVFVVPSRGEGFGLPYVESLAMGKPVIAPIWGGGRMDFLNDKNSYQVDGKMVQATLGDNEGFAREFHNLFTEDMEWFEPDINHLRKQMRIAYEDKALYQSKADYARESIKHLEWSNIAKDIKKAIDEIVEGI